MGRNQLARTRVLVDVLNTDCKWYIMYRPIDIQIFQCVKINVLKLYTCTRKCFTWSIFFGHFFLVAIEINIERLISKKVKTNRKQSDDKWYIKTFPLLSVYESYLLYPHNKIFVYGGNTGIILLRPSVRSSIDPSLSSVHF